MTFKVNDYGGNGGYLAFYVTDAQDAYKDSLWMAGGGAKYYPHLSDCNRATVGNPSEINGITGASVGSGRSLSFTLDLADALVDAGSDLHLDATAENLRESPSSRPSGSGGLPDSAATLGRAKPTRSY